MSNKLAGWTLNCRLPRGSKQEVIICQLIFCLFLCGCARQNAGRWHGLAFYAERQAFTEIVGCQEGGLKGGLDRYITLCEFCMILMSNKLAEWALNCRLPRGSKQKCIICQLIICLVLVPSNHARYWPWCRVSLPSALFLYCCVEGRMQGDDSKKSMTLISRLVILKK